MFIARSQHRTTGHAGRFAEKANVYGAFEAPMDLTEKTVCLVDDVATTGSTLRACADALEAKGAAVWVCTACSA